MERESIGEQSRADKSKGSCTLTGWIEPPQILSALLNFRKMKVGGEKTTSQGQQAVPWDFSSGTGYPQKVRGFYFYSN